MHRRGTLLRAANYGLEGGRPRGARALVRALSLPPRTLRVVHTWNQRRKVWTDPDPSRPLLKNTRNTSLDACGKQLSNQQVLIWFRV